jgi:hypothetical protein
MVAATSSPSTTTTIGFLTRDPIGYLGGSLDLYGFVRGRTLHSVDPSGLSDLIPNLQSCSDFLRDISEGDYDQAVGVPKPISDRIKNGGDYVFCGNCNGIQNRSWDEGGRCHICLSDTATSYPDQWFAILVHELTHCGQFKCPKRNMPIVVGPPIPLPQAPVGGGDCTKCQQLEAAAYQSQCGYLFPNNPIKKAACIKAGVCYSCAGACSKDRGFVGRCKSAVFPVYYPEPVVIPPNA